VSAEKSIYDVDMPVIIPGSYGDCTIDYIKEEEKFVLRHKGIQWMASDESFLEPKDTFYSQYDLAYGDVLLSGLGFGILPKALSQKTSVQSVTVIEINKDIIDAFLKNNKVDSKITIIEADASTYVSDKKYDCLLPDHYELQGVDWTLADMKGMAKRISHDVYWPWSIEEIFLIKTYPKKSYSSETLELYKEEIPVKWREFIAEHLNSHPTLTDISNENLFKYLEKHAKYYYDSKYGPADWAPTK
jgi:hypothetical protein